MTAVAPRPPNLFPYSLFDILKVHWPSSGISIGTTGERQARTCHHPCPHSARGRFQPDRAARDCDSCKSPTRQKVHILLSLPTTSFLFQQLRPLRLETTPHSVYHTW